LFRDHGLSASAVSSLFVAWSVTSFVCEIPSGAWADTVDRRRLLAGSGLVYAAGFACWMLWPGYPGFLLGFVLWGASGAIMSGTFEALLYDSLALRGKVADYTQVKGWCHSAAMTANLAATAAAAPLFHLGGYPLVGWASVLIALTHGALALLLPSGPAFDAGASDGTATRYLAMLRGGVRQAARAPVVRRAVVVCAVLVGLTAYDEYFPLVLAEHGHPTSTVPLLLVVVVAAQAIGTGLAGRTARWSPAAVGWLYGAGGLLVAAGAATGAPADFLLVAAGFGLVNNAFVVSEARLQHVITGPARATVTSVAGLSTEVVTLCTYAVVALGSVWWSLATVVVVLGLPAVGAAVLAARRLPAEPGTATGTRDAWSQ